MSVAIAVPADGPLFEGHFPGRPILPGIAELLLIARALAPGGDAASVSAIPSPGSAVSSFPRTSLKSKPFRVAMTASGSRCGVPVRSSPTGR